MNANYFSNNVNSYDSKKSTLVESPDTIQMSIEEMVKGIKNESNSSDEGGIKEEPLINKSALVSVCTKEDQDINVKGITLNKEAGFLSLLKYKSIRYSFLICCFLWFTMAFTYYGISMGIKNNKSSVFSDG